MISFHLQYNTHIFGSLIHVTQASVPAGSGEGGGSERERSCVASLDTHNATSLGKQG